ncbi:MAG TPA: GDP-L-fucose synthase [Burkholderiaceae bacterium]|nr:GDP-L-fucose synthase [Burkholderiaceae bacterium]
MEKSAPILIAGHTGLIGSAFTRLLESRGYTNLLLPGHTELELSDALAVDTYFARHHPEYVVLAAGQSGGIFRNQRFPADLMRANLAIQSSVLDVAQRHQVRRLIFFASSCMYPRECPQPMTEESLLSGQPEPTSIAYATAKLAGLQLCLAYNRQYGETRFIPVIPNSVYGPGDNFDPASGHVLSSLLFRFHLAAHTQQEEIVLWGSGTPRREFLHADDLAEAGLRLLQHEEKGLPPLPINVGPGQDVSIRDLATTIAGVTGYRGRITWDTEKPDGAPRKLLDSSRIRTLGWAPRIPLAEGIQELYAWYCHQVVSSQ